MRLDPKIPEYVAQTTEALRAIELVDGVSRLCATNLFLHGIGSDDDSREPPVLTDDALRNDA